MTGIFDSQTLAIPCGVCSHQTPKSVRWLKSETQFPCPNCGALVLVDPTDFRARLAEIEKGIAKAGRRLGKR